MDNVPVLEVRDCVAPAETLRAKLELRLKATLASTPIQAVTAAAIPCLWRIQAVNGTVMYADWTGRYLIQGAVIDLKTGQLLETKITGFPNESN